MSRLILIFFLLNKDLKPEKLGINASLWDVAHEKKLNFSHLRICIGNAGCPIFDDITKIQFLVLRSHQSKARDYFK